MPSFKITGPDGKKYKVTGDNAEGAMQALREQLGAQPAAPARPAPIAGSIPEEGESWSPNDPVRPQRPAPVTPDTPVMTSRTPSMMEMAADLLPDHSRRDLQSLDDAVRSFANAATFGQADRLAGLTESNPQERTAEARARNPNLTSVADVGGAVAAPLGLARKGVTLAGRFGTEGMKGIQGFLARAGLMGGEAAAYGATDRALNDKEQNTLDTGLDMLTGFAGGAAGELVGRTVNAIFGSSKPAVAAIQEMRAAKNAAYKATEDMGVRYTPKAFQELASDIADTAVRKGARLKRHPHTNDMIERIGGLADNNAAMTLRDMDQLRQEIWRDLANAPDEAEAEFGKMMVDKLDDFIENATGAKVLTGSGEEASAAIKEARELNRRYRNAQTLEDSLVKAKRRAKSTDSGGNEENAVRQNVRRLLDNERTAKFFTAKEKEALESVIEGTPGQNQLRSLGKKLTGLPGSTGALGLGGGVGFMAGGPGGAAIGSMLPLISMLLGGGLKAGSRSAGRKNARLAEALIRGGEMPKDALSMQQMLQMGRALAAGGREARD